MLEFLFSQRRTSQTKVFVLVSFITKIKQFHFSTLPALERAGAEAGRLCKAYPLLGIVGSEINQQTDLRIENQMHRKWPRVGTYE
ncbi:hypothetical protein LP414_32730 [Polaromonas sp. P1(28)-13]|nr:hypothetical protein LP414_32730 [Polaromonas sp. P1(28)-13]